MKIAACVKIVPDEEQIAVLPSRELSFANTPWKISQYDLNAIEAGKQLAAATSGTLTALSVGGSAALNNSKVRKDVLSRGADDLTVAVCDSTDFADSLETAKALAAAAKGLGADVILCGTGSGDVYAQAVGSQLGALLNLPCTNNVVGITAKDGCVEVERALENSVEVLELPVPCVLSVSSEINNPPVPAMRDIMRAGKKPVNAVEAEAAAAGSEVVSQLAPEQTERAQQVIEGDGEEAVDALVAFLKKEGL